MLIGVILICSTAELLLVALNRRGQVTFSTKSVEAVSSRKSYNMYSPLIYPSYYFFEKNIEAEY